MAVGAIPCSIGEYIYKGCIYAVVQLSMNIVLSSKICDYQNLFIICGR